MSHVHHTSHVSPHHMDHSTHHTSPHVSPHHMSPHHMAPVHHHMIPQEDTPHYITIGFVVFSILLGLIAIVLGGLAVSGNINFFKVEASGNILSDKEIGAKGVISTESGFRVRPGPNFDTDTFSVDKNGHTEITGTLEVIEQVDFFGDVNVNTNKFNVKGNTGDTTIGGTLDVTGKFGYKSGGTVTQLTSKSAGVTLNNLTGTITMNGASLASNTSASFTVTNSTVEANDIIIVNHKSGGTSGSYRASADTITNGTFNITVTNISGSNLSESVVISFIVIKGAIA